MIGPALRIGWASVAACVLVLGAVGCGDDDDESADTSTAPPAQTEPTTTTDAETPTSTATTPQEPAPPPEEQPGGAGDEEPAQSQAAFTGRAGRVTPPRVRVPPFIAIRVELRSADGGEYGLSCGDRELRVDADIETASTRVAGRRPGDLLRCAPLGGHNGAVIVASAEPGP